MNPPNPMTILILISLAQLIQIPIQSIYDDQSEEDPIRRQSLQRNFNRIYFPKDDQYPLNRIHSSPIVIFWASTQTNTGTDPDCVIPFFPIEQHVSSHRISHPFNQTILTKVNIHPSQSFPKSLFI